MAEAKTARMAAHGLRLTRDRLRDMVDQREVSSEDVEEMIDDLSSAIATIMAYFDVCMSMRAEAVAAGAVGITLLELATMTRARRRGGALPRRPLCRLPEELIEERGMPGSGVAIWRRGEGRGPLWQGTVGEFLDRPDYQSGTWLIDGGWGGPPGPIEVDWIDGEWINQGYLGNRRAQ